MPPTACAPALAYCPESASGCPRTTLSFALTTGGAYNRATMTTRPMTPTKHFLCMVSPPSGLSSGLVLTSAFPDTGSTADGPTPPPWALLACATAFVALEGANPLMSIFTVIDGAPHRLDGLACFCVEGMPVAQEL